MGKDAAMNPEECDSRECYPPMSLVVCSEGVFFASMPDGSAVMLNEDTCQFEAIDRRKLLNLLVERARARLAEKREATKRWWAEKATPWAEEQVND